MSQIQDTTQPKAPAANPAGYTLADYKGAPSTLCPGCGHESITNQIIRALYETGVDPYRVAKLSGIGCSSKTTAYLLSLAHGFNGVHGRAAAMATGSYVANKGLLHITISGDGDTASIGLGNFLHMVRRNVPLVYIIENNGVYALTKGQLSATADIGVSTRYSLPNQMMPIDCCALAIQLGCGYVARSFSGDVKQLLALLKGAFSHPGTVVLDVISPCVTFGNLEGSTKSFRYAREAEEPLHELSFIPHDERHHVDYEPGTCQTVELPDGSELVLKKLGRDYDATNRSRALELLDKAQAERLFLTGLIYHNPHEIPPLGAQLELGETPLVELTEEQLRPSPQALEELMEELK